MSRGRGQQSTPIVLILIRPFVSMALCVLIIAPYPPPPLCSNIKIYLPDHQVESFSNKNHALLALLSSPNIENLLFTLLDIKNLWFIAAIALCACLWSRAHAHIPMPKEHWLYCNFRLFMHACAHDPKLSLYHRTLLAICHFQIFWQYRKLRTGHLFIMISSAWT